MLKIFHRKEKKADGSEVIQVIAEAPADEFFKLGSPTHQAEYIYNHVLEGIAMRYIDLNYNAVVANINPAILATEIQRTSARLIAEKMIHNLKF